MFQSEHFDEYPDAALAHQHPAVDEVLDSAAHRRPGQAQLVGQVDLVLQPGSGHQLPGVDEVLQMLGDLEIQRYRAVPVDLDGRGNFVHGFLSRGHLPPIVIMADLRGWL